MTMDTVMWADAAVADWLAAGLPYSAFEALVRDGLTDGKTPQDVIQAAAGMAADARARAASRAEAVSDAWPEPLPFGAVEVPEVGADAMPEPLRSFAIGVAEELQVPEGAVALVSACAVATAMAKRAVIMGGGNWSEPLNLYAAVVLPPGERKSALVSACKAPLEAWEAERSRADAPRIEACRAEKRILDGRARMLEKKATTSRDPAHREEAIRAAQEAAAYKIPSSDRLLVDNITPEKLVGAMLENWNRIALISEEPGILKIMGGLYSGGTANIDVFLKGHSGDTIRVDRMGRPSEFVPNPALTLCLAMQPGLIASMGAGQGFRDSGLLARFLYLIPVSRMGEREIETEPVSVQVQAAYSRAIRFLLDLPMGQNLPDGIKPFRLHLSPEARTLFVALRTQIEPKLKPDAELGSIADWAGKLPGAILRLAGIMHSIKLAHEHREPWGERVSAETMQQAISLGEALQVHALAAFGRMVAQQDQERAALILEWIRKRKKEKFTRRDLYRSLARRFARSEEMDAPLSLLEDRGYIREASIWAAGSVRRSTPGFEAHPSCMKTQNGHSSGSARASTDALTRGGAAKADGRPVNGGEPPARQHSVNTGVDGIGDEKQRTIARASTKNEGVACPPIAREGVSPPRGNVDKLNNNVKNQTHIPSTSALTLVDARRQFADELDQDPDFDDTGADREVWQ